MNFKNLTQFRLGRVKVEIHYHDNGGTKSDDLKTGILSNYGLGLKMILDTDG